MHPVRLKHRFIYTLLSTLTLAGVWSCRKDVETFRPYPPTLEAIQGLLEQAPAASTHSKFTLSNVVTDTEISTPGGVRVFLTDTEHLFADASGNPVPCSTCQNIDIEVTEALSKGDIIARGIPTVSTDGTLLESGGMAHIVVTCDGKPLVLLPDRKLKIQIPANNPAADMLLFNGLVQNDTFIGWQNSAQPAFQADWQVNSVGVQGYELFSPLLGWVNCDRPVDDTINSLCVELPAQFNPENTAAYLVFKDIRSVAVLEYNMASRSFCYHRAPVGFQVRLVTVSKTADGQFWLGNKETEIGTNAPVTVEPKQTGEQQILNFLKSL